MSSPPRHEILSDGADTSFAVDMYTDRAVTYDTATGGWHIEFGRDFAEWIAPAPGSSVLDLACGTGLVTIPMAVAVGATGTVVGLDITKAMLDQARAKRLPEGAAAVEWVEADIAGDLSGLEAVRRVLEEQGGFDVISCCSAFVMLKDPVAMMKNWAGLLKTGGRIIVDVPTEQKTVQYLFMEALRVKLGMPLPFKERWVKDIRSLEKVYEQAGLVLETSWKTKSYVPEEWFEDVETVRDHVFDSQTKELYLGFEREGKLEEARGAWKDVWKMGVADRKGRVFGGHQLYVSIGTKP